ncbi:MAG: rRNA maturation RNase YbeY [Magnetospirillum sp. WYHS-4]
MTDFFDLAVMIENEDWERRLPDADALARRAALAAFAAVPHPARPCEAGLLLTDDTAVRALNRDYRGQDKPTNVLSFPAWDGEDLPEGAAVPLGDVAIALGVLAAEAEVEGKPLADHFSHLVVHGILHLMGHDHERGEREAAAMEDLECRVLAALGIPDPYREPEGFA